MNYEVVAVIRIVNDAVEGKGRETHASCFAKSATTNTSSIESQLSRRSETLGEPVERESAAR